MNPEFKSYMLNEQGKQKSDQITKRFDGLLDDLKYILNNYNSLNDCPYPEFSIAKTKLEEACFYVKKAMARNPDNNEGV